MFRGKRVVVVTYADKKYKKVQYLCAKTAMFLGKADAVHTLGPEDLDEEFKNSNKRILDIQRGAGLWLWKPYVILKIMDEVEDGDYVFYCDSAVMFIRNINDLLSSMKKKDFIWVSDCPFIEGEWTKPQVFQHFNMDISIYGKTNQIESGFIIVKKTKKSVQFIQEWMELCGNYELIRPIGAGEYKGICIENRDDQSLLSLLCKSKQIKAHRDPSQFGKVPEKYLKEKRSHGKFTYRVPIHPNDKYKPVILLHRLKKINLKFFRTLIIGLALIYLPENLSKRMIGNYTFRQRSFE